MSRIFHPACMLLPDRHAGIDFSSYSVIACDQFTSEQAYWKRIEKHTTHLMSTYHLILPECYLNHEDLSQRLHRIDQTMQRYQQEKLLTAYPSSLFYIERRLRNGKLRKGIVGKVDLEAYNYVVGAKTLVRATEGTVLERLPPRVKVRQQALLELPHIMLLMDDIQGEVIESLGEHTAHFELLYDFSLMENSGHLTGWKLDQKTQEKVLAQLDKMTNNCLSDDSSPVLFAVGDGNHSLAAAKACYEQLKQTLSPSALLHHPARYALVELVNLHDESLNFEPIHRVVFDVDVAHLMDRLKNSHQMTASSSIIPDQQLNVIIQQQEHILQFCPTDHSLVVDKLQQFLDRYLTEQGGTLDYIHGKEVVYQLSKQANTIGFCLPSFPKSDLFDAVSKYGVLPRKTFSMGEAWDKRFYLEARSIRS